MKDPGELRLSVYRYCHGSRNIDCEIKFSSGSEMRFDRFSFLSSLFSPSTAIKIEDEINQATTLIHDDVAQRRNCIAQQD